MSKPIPKQLDSALVEIAKRSSRSIQTSGQGAMVLVTALNYLQNFGMNNMLAQVHSLQMITHLMMMQLNYPVTAALFFGSIFEYVTFDILPTDDIYGKVFELVEESEEFEPYSEQADATGYGSRYAIINTGSCFIFVNIMILQYSLLFACRKCQRPGSKCANYTSKKLSGFFWAGLVDFIGEFYLNAAFSVGINSTRREFTDLFVAVNNIFALLLALALVILPIVMVLMLCKKFNSAHTTQIQALEGGELESPQKFLLSRKLNVGHRTPAIILGESLPKIPQIKLSFMKDDEQPSQQEESVSKAISKCCQSKKALTKASCCGKMSEKQRDDLLAKHSNQLKEIDSAKQADSDTKASFGSFIDSLGHRYRVSKRSLIFLVIWSYMRPLLQAIIILTLY